MRGFYTLKSHFWTLVSFSARWFEVKHGRQMVVFTCLRDKDLKTSCGIHENRLLWWTGDFCSPTTTKFVLIKLCEITFCRASFTVTI